MDFFEVFTLTAVNVAFNRQAVKTGKKLPAYDRTMRRATDSRQGELEDQEGE